MILAHNHATSHVGFLNPIRTAADNIAMANESVCLLSNECPRHARGSFFDEQSYLRQVADLIARDLSMTSERTGTTGWYMNASRRPHAFSGRQSRFWATAYLPTHGRPSQPGASASLDNGKKEIYVGGEEWIEQGS